MEKSLQDTFGPSSICFGCGPSNKQGLQIKSFPQGETVVAEWSPEPFHEAFPGVLNGGIIGALLDCHSNWTAAWHLKQKGNLDQMPCTVTADFHVKLMAPTPSGQKLSLVAKVLESSNSKAKIEATLSCNGVVTANCVGTFVAVKPGHPAYHRWG